MTTSTQSTALTTLNVASSDIQTITSALERAHREAHLVSPAAALGTLPDGFEVALSTVLVDVARETYAVAGGDDDGGGGGGGKRGLAKGALDRIALAAGVSWIESRRIDDGRDPRYCAWLAVGRVKGFDGSEIVIQGSKEVDLRDKSPQVDALWARYHAKLERWERDGKKGWAPKSPEGQLREQRLHMVSMCETKARLRAIRSIGVRTAYSPEELRKPFVVARLAFTGRSEDPELRRTFAVMAAQNALAASHAMYGPDHGSRRLPAAPVVPQLPAPPMGRSLVEDDDVPDAELVEEPTGTTMPPGRDTAPAAYAGTDTAGAPSPAPSSTAARCPHCDGTKEVCPTCRKVEGPHADCAQDFWVPCPACCTAPAATSSAPAPERRASTPGGSRERPAPAASDRASPSGAVVRFGRDKGRPLADVEKLDWYAGAIERDVNDPAKERWRDQNERHLEEVRAEIARREGGGGDDLAGTPLDDDIPFVSSEMRRTDGGPPARWERW